MAPTHGIPVLDRVVGLRRTGGNERLYERLLDVFLADAPRLTSQLCEAVERRSAPRLCRAAHSVRGSASAIGAMAVLECAGILEELARKGDLRNAEIHHGLVLEEISRLTVLLRARSSGEPPAANTP